MLKQPILEFKDEFFFLSNFYPSPFRWEGIEWKTVEHAYQAAKCMDVKEARVIAELNTPGQAKRAGRKVQALRPNWDIVKFPIMDLLVMYKFQYNPDLLQKLIDTYPAHLEEGNWWNDRIWGVSPAGSGNGLNNLGKSLMKLRDEIVENS